MKNSWILIVVVTVIIVGLVAYLIYRQVHECYVQNDPKLHQLKNTLKPMFSEENYYTGVLEPLNRRDILEEIDLTKGYKSKTIDKEKVQLCVNDENGEYYDFNMLIYVTLHELSHVICPERDHTPLFFEIFDALLAEATKRGIYNPNVPLVQDYCNYKD